MNKSASHVVTGEEPQRHPVTQARRSAQSVAGQPDPQLDGSDAPRLSAMALARSLGLSHRALLSGGRLRSLKEVADYLDVSIRTVRRLIVRGELRAHRVGRSLRIQDAELARYVAATME